MSNVKKMRQAKLDMNWWDEMWEERIIGIVAKLGLLAALFLYGCGDSSGRMSSRGEWENSLSRARQLERSVDVLLASASTNDLSRFLHGYVEGWEKSNQEIRESYRALPDSVRTVSNIKVRLELCGWIEKRVFENPLWGSLSYGEANYFLCSAEMLDALSKVIWDTSHDEEMVLGLWKRQRQRYAEMRMACEGPLAKAKAEEQRLRLKGYRLSQRLMQVSLKDLTKDELALREECRRLPDLEKEIRCIETLMDWYGAWDVGEIGKQLLDGGLYFKFKRR